MYFQIHKTFHFPCHSSGLIIHAYYDRHVDIFDRNHTIRILRLKCSSCNSTHAVLIEDTVPYSIVSFDIIIDVLKNKDFLSSSHVSFIIDYISFFGGRLSIVTVSNVLKDLKSLNATLALSL